MAQTLVQTDLGYRACVITPEMYAAYWTKLEIELEKIRGYWEPWWTLDFIRRCQLFGVTVWECGPRDRTAVFAWTQVVTMPAMNVFQVVLIMGNDLDKCIPHLEACFEQASRLFECEELEIIGRRGWGRKLGKCHEVATVFRRKAPNLRIQ